MMKRSNIIQISEYRARYFGEYSCKGINFCLGDNGDSHFYETKVRGIYWRVFRDRTWGSWLVHAEENDCFKLLNCRSIHLDGTVEDGPLYSNNGDKEDVPQKLLEALADYINSGVDHWQS